MCVCVCVCGRRKRTGGCSRPLPALQVPGPARSSTHCSPFGGALAERGVSTMLPAICSSSSGPPYRLHVLPAMCSSSSGSPRCLLKQASSAPLTAFIPPRRHACHYGVTRSLYCGGLRVRARLSDRRTRLRSSPQDAFDAASDGAARRDAAIFGGAVETATQRAPVACRRCRRAAAAPRTKSAGPRHGGVQRSSGNARDRAPARDAGFLTRTALVTDKDRPPGRRVIC